NDANAVPNDGVRVNLTAYLPASFPANSSFQAGAEEVVGTYEAVFGLFQNDRLSPTAFFTVFQNQSDTTVLLEYWTLLSILPGDSYDFALERVSGTTWELTVNGEPFGANTTAASFDFKASSSTWLPGVSFSEVALYQGGLVAPSSFAIPLALAVHRPGSGWYLPTDGVTTFAQNGGPQWGVEGRAQHASLAPGELETGTSIANATNGTLLWSGGPVPVVVSLNLVPRAAVATQTIVAFVNVTDASGTPIPGAPVYFADSLGGTFLPSTVGTGGTGGGQVVFFTPNVTQNSSDNVRATVTLLGYSGSAASSVSLTPAQEVLLSVAPSTLTIRPGSSGTLTFRATSPQGVPLSGVLLTFQIVGLGGIQPSAASTGSDGTVPIEILAPNVPTTVTVVGVVSGAGYWGRLSVAVQIADSAVPYYVSHAPELVEVAAGMAVAAAIVIVALKTRGRQRSIPSLVIDDYDDEPSDAGAESKGSEGLPEEPPTRTPP
ncbi:MAG: hypothetical protein L3K09_06480, partial [Thermoplasmata archaeon]|nr:hypothetical protein [Thermoplasmata archaeon]